MTWKILPSPSSGSSSKFGGVDMNKLSNLLSGVDVDDVSVSTDWEFTLNAMPNLIAYRAGILSNGDRIGAHLDGKNNLGTRKTFGKIYTEIEDRINGTEDSAIAANALVGGADKNIFYVNKTQLFWGDSPQPSFSTSGLTGSRTYTLPNATTKLAGTTTFNTFTQPQTVENYLDLKEMAEPASPATGYSRLYRDEDDGLVKVKHSDGDVVILE